MRPSLTVGLPSFGAPPGGDWRRLVDLARMAEDAGVDRVIVSDHVVLGPNLDAYPWGRFPTRADAPWLEPLTVLTAMAAATTSIRLATGILIAPLRPAALLAKTVATIEVISGGRLDLGVGTGWQPEEYAAEGLDFADRGRLLTDTIAACRALWEELPADFTSPSLSFEALSCSPQPGHRVPVWFAGGLHGRNLERILTLGDGWIPHPSAGVETVAEGAERLRQSLVAAGRDPASVGVQGSPGWVRDADGKPDLPATLDRVPALVAAGATDVNVNLRLFCAEPGDAPAVLRAMVEGFNDAIRSPDLVPEGENG
jgi:probable F420-dependent oxidoreductase